MTRSEFEWLRHNLAKSTFERMVTATAWMLLLTLILIILKLVGFGEWLYCTFPLLITFLVITGGLVVVEVYLILLERRVKND